MMSVGDIMRTQGGGSVHWGFHTNSVVSSMNFPTINVYSEKSS